MLFELLTSPGSELPAALAEALAGLEARLMQRARETGLLVALIALAGLAALAAFAVGLVALDRWVALGFGPFAGYAVTGGLMLAIMLALLGAAMAKARPARGATATATNEGRQASPAASGGLLEPLGALLAKIVRVPGTGNPLLDEVLVHLNAPARSAVDDAVEHAVEMIRTGESEELFGALGLAVFVGWLLAPQPPPGRSVQ